jgi:hypothetical protein
VTSRLARWATPASASVVAVVVLVLLVALLPILALGHELSLGSYCAPYAIYGSFAAVGFVLARRRPANPIGWLMLVGIGGGILGSDAGYYAWAAYGVHRHGLPLESLALLIGEVGGTTTVIAGFPLVMLLFPDGRAPSRTWKRVIVAFLGLVALGLACELAEVAIALSGPRLAAATVNNGPGGGLLYHLPPGTRWLAVVPSLSVFVAAVLVVAATVRQVVSYRRAQGVRRQQLKCAAGGLIVCVLAIAALASGTANGGGSLVAQIWSQIPWVALSAVPISIGVAILRFRLYDIDRLISRTLGYAILTALLGGIFIGLVALMTDTLALSGRVGVATSTLAAAALFNPLRLRIQRQVDRRFNRARYDAEATVAAFTAQLRDAVELDAIGADLLETVHRVLAPTHASIWIKQ